MADDNGLTNQTDNSDFFKKLQESMNPFLFLHDPPFFIPLDIETCSASLVESLEISIPP